MKEQKFEHIWTREVPQIGIKAHLYRHVKTSAELLHLENDDPNKAFGVSFRTIPHDNTGVAHILEHSVLAGSKKYPVRDPFITMNKSSLKTYINALTYPDRTNYPVASVNEKDFHNLISVYLDAVFNPLLREDTFKQEGWHYELREDNILTVKGVVYNEMKGAYSEVDNLVESYFLKSLLPDTLYAMDSGGNPEYIPDLSYEAFKQFHATYYHPTNAQFYFYGSLDITSYFELIDSYIGSYTPGTPRQPIALQPVFSAPRILTYDIPVQPDKKEKGGVVLLGWLLGDEKTPVCEQRERVAWWILAQALIGSDASPFKKALLESGLGESIAGTAYEADIQQPVFTMGLKNVAVSDFDNVEALFSDQLQKIVREGFDKEFLESLIARLDFYFHEMEPNDYYPKPVHLFATVLQSWSYGRDPLENLDVFNIIEDLKTHVAQHDRYFEQIVEKRLLNNPHKIILRCVPNEHYETEQADKERARLQKLLETWSDTQKKEVREQTQRNDAYQKTGDTPDALATLPYLNVNDIPKESTLIPFRSVANKIYATELATHNIVYASFAFDVTGFSFEDKKLLPLLSEYLFRIATRNHTAEEIAQLFERFTGGNAADMAVEAKFNNSGKSSQFIVSVKFMEEYTDQVLGLLEEVFTELDFTDLSRLRRIIKETTSEIDSSLVSNAVILSESVSRSFISQLYAEKDFYSGVGAIRLLNEWNRLSDQDFTGLINEFRCVYTELFNVDILQVHLTTEKETLLETTQRVERFINRLPERSVATNGSNMPDTTVKSKAIIIPAQVSFSTLSIPFSLSSDISSGALRVVIKLLNNEYLWKTVRQQGGAYGSGVRPDFHAHLVTFYSYRDPHIAETLETFRNAGTFLIEASKRMSQRDLDNCIIGAIAPIDYPYNAEMKGSIAFTRHLIGMTQEQVQQIRNEILGTTTQQMAKWGEALLSVNNKDTGFVTCAGESLINDPKNRSLFESIETINGI